MKYKLFLFALIIIFSLSLVSSLELGISPGELLFNGKTGEKICQNITIRSDYRGEIIGETRWVEDIKGKRDIKNYKLNAEDLGINVDYPQNVNMTKSFINLKFCLISKKSGDYSGAIIYKTKEGYAGVGSWILVHVSGSNTNYGMQSITGKTISSDVKIKNNPLVLISIVIFVMLILMLGTLFFISKKLKNKKPI